MKIRLFSILVLLLLVGSVGAADGLLVVSWNIKDLGQSKNAEEIRFIAEQIRHADIVAVQEVVAGDGGAQAVARLADELNRTGARWDYRISDPTDSPPYYTERYAFLWKPHRAKMIGRPYLESRLARRIAREPYVARFRVEGRELLIVNYHSVPWDKKPAAEAQYLDLFPQFYPGTPILYTGDYNLSEQEYVFDRLESRGFQPVLYRQPTTVRRKNGYQTDDYLLHAIDNIFYDRNYFQLLEGGIIDFVPRSGSLKAANRISDHVPVWGAVRWKSGTQVENHE